MTVDQPACYAPPPAQQYGGPPVYVASFYPSVPVAQAPNPLLYAYVLVPIAVTLMGAIISALASASSSHSQAPPAAVPVAPPAAVAIAPPATAARTRSAAGDPLAARPVLTPSAGAYTARQSAVIRFDGMPAGSNGWVSIAKAGTSPSSYLTYHYASGSGEVSFPLSGYPPGAYVARAYADSGYTVVAEVPFAIRSTANR